MEDVIDFLQDFLLDVKTRAIAIVKNPVYVGLFILFLLSSSTSAYILFAYQNNSSTVSTTTPPQTLLAIPSLSPTPNQVQMQSEPTDTPEASSAAVPTPTPSNITLNWLTYTNTTYGYSIKYPTDWTASDEGELEPLIPSYILFNPASASPASRTITISYTTRTSDELTAIYGTDGSQMTVDNFSATEHQTTDSDGNKAISVILPLGINALIFYSIDQYQDTLMQMLGTFQLTN